MKRFALIFFAAMICSYAFAGGPGPVPADPVGIAGDTDAGRRQRILKSHTNYAIVFTAQANGVFCELKSDWYEHTDGD